MERTEDPGGQVPLGGGLLAVDVPGPEAHAIAIGELLGDLAPERYGLLFRAPLPGGIFDEPPMNVFQIKATYWWWNTTDRASMLITPPLEA